jgi:hypothetical protein
MRCLKVKYAFDSDFPDFITINATVAYSLIALTV